MTSPKAHWSHVPPVSLQSSVKKKCNEVANHADFVMVDRVFKSATKWYKNIDEKSLASDTSS